MTRAQSLMLAAAVVVAGALAYAAFAVAPNADYPQPPRQAAPDDDMAAFLSHTLDGYPGHVCELKDHHAGYVYTKHRYPRVTGGEITAVIHRGFAPMRVPANTPDAQWIVAPPSEVMY